MIPDIPTVEAPPAYYWNGFGINAGALCVDQVSPIDHYSNGFAFTASGQLAATTSAPPAYYHNGYAFNDGRVIL